LPAAVDDSLAEAVGLENLAELRQEVRQRMQRDYDSVARQRVKRALLDKLAERYDFPVPPGMVEMEFNTIWAQHESEKEARKQFAARQSGGMSAEEGPVDAAALIAPEETALEGASDSEPTASEDQDEEKLKEDYHRIAERRVRLGLLLAEAGRSNNITVTQEELNQALAQEARRHPGYERQVIDFYRKSPEAINNLRAPIFEEKVVDFILELAKPTERKVTPQELMTGAGEDENGSPEAAV
jgi:trigger factor